MTTRTSQRRVTRSRRGFLGATLGLAGASLTLGRCYGADPPVSSDPSQRDGETAPPATAQAGTGVASPPVGPREKLRITRLETQLIKPRWLFLKVHTDAGIVGLGEPIVEGRAKTCARPSPSWSLILSARTLEPWSRTGRPCTDMRFIGGARF